MTGEGGDPEGNEKDRPAARPDHASDLIYGVASLTAPLAQPAAVRSPQTPRFARRGGTDFRSPPPSAGYAGPSPQTPSLRSVEGGQARSTSNSRRFVRAPGASSRPTRRRSPAGGCHA